MAATNFADNAHDYKVSLYDATTKALIITSPVLQDGNVTTPSIGLTEQPPTVGRLYAWIRSYSRQTLRLEHLTMWLCLIES